jgi:thymidylate synthase
MTNTNFATTYDDFSSAWFALLQNLFDNGKPVSPRGFETHELLGVQLRVSDMTKNIIVHPARALSYRFAVAEWLWMAAGRNDVETISRYNKHIAQFSDDGAVFAGAYGVRLQPQIDYLLEQLRKPHSRQAVASIWTPTPAPSKDIPCTLSWQLLARDGKLHAIVTMRSSDVWLGISYDFINFSQLTNGLAGELGLVPGSLTFNLGSSHLYDRDREKAAGVLAAPELLQCVSSPRLPSKPPAEAILAYDELLTAPWSIYRDALQARTSVDALTCLEVLSEPS